MSEEKGSEDKPSDSQDAIHPQVDEGLKTIARWVAEDIMRKVGMNDGKREG